MRYVTAGESHGRILTAIVTGVPAGIEVRASAIDSDLARRQSGYGRGGRQRIEADRVSILSGVRFDRTLGTPVALAVANRDWDNWTEVMAVSGEKPDAVRETRPRPGHADLAGAQKIGTDDVRDVLERASARETAARVAAGGVAKAFLAALGVEILSYVSAIGPVAMEPMVDAAAVSREAIEASEVRCPDASASERMMREIDAAKAEGESLGGVFVVAATGLVPGIGGYAEAGQRLDARLAAALMSVPAIKGVEIGDGFALAARRGSQAHDEIVPGATGYARATNHAGGLEGGMANGEPLVVRAAMKPIPTLMKPLRSVDLDTFEEVSASIERSDVCAVPAAAVVAEAELAFVLARAFIEKFGGDTLVDILAARDRYLTRIAR
ncbi:MAG: chorismate synthase [Coriobacteriia bacterium]|jgi:chorismate synthase|nr:chorismate synthase [Coriobacteriia bacterium]